MAKYLIHPADMMGCGLYRLLLPAYALRLDGDTCDIEHVTIDDVSGYDVIVFQRIHKTGLQETLKQYRRQAPNAAMVMDIDDDLFRLPHIFSKDDCERFVEACNFMDKVIVSTDYLKQRLIAEGVTQPIVVRRNMVSAHFWKTDTATNKRCLKKPRVLIAGAMGHAKNGDLGVIRDLPKKLGKKVQIVTLGDEVKKMWGTHLKGVTHLPFCAINDFPAYVRAIAADYWLAPLNPNLEFNNSKSNIKYLEATMAGALLCAQRSALPYANLPGVIYYDTLDELAGKIKSIKDAEYIELYKEAYINVLNNYILETNYGVEAIRQSWSK